MSQLLKFKTNGPSRWLRSLEKISIKLGNSMLKFLFPARETYDLTPALTFFYHGFPLLIEVNLFCDKSIILIFGNRSN